MRELEPALTIGDVAAHLGLSVDSSIATRSIRRLAPLATAQATDLSFLSDARYASQLTDTKAAAILIDQDRAGQVPAGSAALVVPDPYLAFARVTGLFRQHLDQTDSDETVGHQDSTARIDATAQVDSTARIGAHCVVGAHALIGAGVRLGAGTVIGDRAKIGPQSAIGPNVTIYADSRLGEYCAVQAGTVIGSDGFGYAKAEAGWTKIWQLGNAVIGDRVEIGANCCIDRGALEDTVIGDDCILDNLIQVAHNVRIGSGTALAGCVGIAGSAVIGKNCLIGGSAGILGHLELADGVVVSPKSLVTRSLRKPGFYSGSFPLMENAQWEKAAAALRRLPDLRSRLRQLEKMTRETE